MPREHTEPSIPELDADFEAAPTIGDVEAVFFEDAEEFYRTHGHLNPDELAGFDLDQLVHIQEALRHERIETQSQIERLQSEMLRRQSKAFQRSQALKSPETDDDSDTILEESEFWELLEMMEPAEYVDFINEETEQLPSSILEWHRGFLLHVNRSYTADQFNLDLALQKAVRDRDKEQKRR